ncbi:MAG: hypothetical protein J6W00_09070 [Lentisphaeria bacterium]|nr:hypothetical protein [Lentisphaeria bacterium]
MNFSIDYLRSFLKANVDPNEIIAIITADVKQYVLSRKQNPELFAREVYKWDLVRKWYKRNIKTVEDLREWVSGKLYDPSSSKKCINNLINQSSFGDWQDGILKGQRGNDDELAAAMQAMRVDNFSEIQALPINNWVNRSGQKKKIDLRIFSTYLMCHDPFNIMQYKDTEFHAARKKWNLSIGIKSNGFTKWQEFAKNILLPLLAEEMNVNIAEPFDFSKLDIENEIDSIREGKFLCMIDVQDFVWMTFHHSESTEPQLTFWKISHGPDDISNEEYAIFESKHLAVVHGLTKAKGKEKESQGDKFIHKIKKGDFFYLCRGNSIRIFGQFDSDEAVINPEKQNDWYQRSYKLIAPSLDTAPYNGSQKWWTPNHNSTCYNIDDNKDF